MRKLFRTIGLSLLSALGSQLLQSFVTPTPAQAQYIITLPNGVVCEGQFRGYTGNGICQYPDGYYRGQIVNGIRQGQGLFYYYPSGEGSESAESGSQERVANTYQGDFRNDRPNGRGRFVFTNESRYEGEVRNGLPHGTGSFIFTTRDPEITTEPIPGEPYFVNAKWKQDEYISRYYGQFEDGVFSGRGTLIYGVCRPYQINGRDDLRCARYDGTFRNGKPHGQGTYNDDLCSIINGRYDCIRYTGNFWGGQPNGNGRLIIPEYGNCDGQFNDFTLSGRATCRYHNGDVYTGDLSHGVPHGYGSYRSANGRVSFTGEFRLGRPFAQSGLPIGEIKFPEIGGGFPRYPGRP